jgi:GntR family transcriptional regulator
MYIRKGKYMLNSSSPVPLYHQLAEILSSQIEQGEFQIGEKIPSENELAKQYQIGRPTVRQAIDVLIRKRILERKHGAGTFVSNKSSQVDLFSLAGTSHAFRQADLDIHTKMVHDIQIKKVKESDTNPFSSQQAFYFSRISLYQDNPFLLEDFYLDPIVFKNFDQIRVQDHSLSSIVEKNYYLALTDGKQSFKIVYLDKNKAKFLNISQDQPVLLVQRYLSFEEQKNVIFSEIFCLTDQFEFTQTIQINH